MMEERDEFRGSRQRLYSRAKRRRGLLLAAAALTALGAGAFFFYRLVYRVEPAFSTVVYELGQEVSSDVGDYLTGTDWSVGTAQLDLSEVDESRAGSYQAVVHHGSSAFQYEIVIQDTVPPKILSAEGPVYLALGREYGTDALVAGVEDRARCSWAFRVWAAWRRQCSSMRREAISARWPRRIPRGTVRSWRSL